MPDCSPHSNSINTFKRDYLARMSLRDALLVLAQLPAAFERFNEVHPHSSLKRRSPREFRRQQTAGGDQAFYCEWEGAGNTEAASEINHGAIEDALLKEFPETRIPIESFSEELFWIRRMPHQLPMV